MHRAIFLRDKSSDTGFKGLVSLALMAAALLVGSRGHALNPQRALYQDAHTVWRTQDGYFDGTPTQVMQDADGYIWVGSSMGLSRLLGGSFVPQDAALGRVPSGVNSMLLARDGTVWVGGSAGLQAIRKGKLAEVSSWNAEVHAAMEVRDGSVWVTRVRIRDGKGPLCRVDGLRMDCIGPEKGITEHYATALAEDSTGAKWFGSSAVNRLQAGERTKSSEGELNAASGGGGSVRSLLPMQDGSMLAALDASGPHGGVQQYKNGKWRSYDAAGLHGSEVVANALYADREGALWIGTADQGLYRIWRGKVDHFEMRDGLSGDQVNDVREDVEGNVWIATTEGVDCFRNIPVADFTPRKGLTRSLSGPILARSDGTVWIAEKGNIDVWRDGTIAPLQQRLGQTVRAFYEDRAGRVWIAVDNRLLLYQEGRVREIRTREAGASATPDESVSSMAEDSSGRLWAVVSRNGSRSLLEFADGRLSQTVVLPARDRAKWLAADQVGGVWLGSNSGELSYMKDRQRSRVALPTTSHTFGITDIKVAGNDLLVSTGIGLFLRDHQRWTLLDQGHGLPCSPVYSAIPDGTGGLWLSASCGLVRVSLSDVQRFFRDEAFRIPYRLLGRLEGVFPGDPDAQPRAARSNDGRLWFTNGVVLQMIEPAGLADNPHPPPVHIDGLYADRHPLEPSGDVRLPANTQEIEIQYSGLSYVQPNKVNFRYKLQGHDEEWQQVGTRRAAFYNNLAPGRYAFRVIACNNDGIWNAVGAGLEFVVLPAFYQTLWFQVLIAVLLAASLWGVYTIRVEQVSKGVRMRLLARMTERERIARDLHDTFFQGIQGLLLRFQTATSKLPKDNPSRAMLEQALQQSDAVMLEGRELVLDLRNEDDHRRDLAGLFNSSGESFQQYRTVDFSVVVNGRMVKLHPIVFDELERLGREALFNAFRHSQANKIEVELNYGVSEFQVRFRDDGIGIDPATVRSGGVRGHWGVPGMRERAKKLGAQLNVWTRRNAGTEIEVHVPAAVAYERQSRPSLVQHWWYRLGFRKEEFGAPRFEADSRNDC